MKEPLSAPVGVVLHLPGVAGKVLNRDAWQMEHNAHRGAQWFFHSEARIEQYKNMVPRKAEKTVAQRMDGEFNKIEGERLEMYKRIEAQIEARSRGETT